MNILNNLGLTTLPNMIIDGRDNAVTLIIKASTVPIGTPAINKASAIGITSPKTRYKIESNGILLIKFSVYIKRKYFHSKNRGF